MIGRVELTNKLASRKLGIEEKKVESVMTFFYKELSEELTECRYPHIYVRDFGTFTMRLKPVENRIKSLLYLRRKLKWKLSMKQIPKFLAEKYDMGIVREIFNLFRIRRMIKENKKQYKALRNAGKIVYDIQRKPLQTNRKEQTSL